MTYILVSVDGPTSAGKSTLGQWLSEHLKVPFLETGLTYRAVALAIVHLGHRPSSCEMGTILDRLEHRPYEAMSSRSEAVYLDGADVTHLVWSDQCNGVLPWVSESDDLRGQILEFNRKMVVSPMVVAGRDVAPTLLPDARPKIYLDASYSVRRLRRRAQVGAGGFGTPVAGPKSKIDLATREYVASDPSGLIIDTSDLAIEEVRKRVLERASE